MKHKQHLLCSALLVLASVSLCTIPVFAVELTEAEVEQAVASQGKEAVTGNVFIWFLCAIAFLKVSQKIDSFMASLGINVGNTGSNMMSELLIAGRSLAGSMHLKGGGSTGSGGGYRKVSSPGDAAVGGSFLSGGLAGSVGRQTERSAVNAATQYTEHSSVGSSLYHSSLNKGGDFANNVISSIAQGNYSQVGSIKGEDAEKAYISYMGIKTENVQAGISQPGTSPTGNGHNGMDQATFSYGGADQTGFSGGTNQTDSIQPIPSYTNIEIGGGRITGTETTADSGSRDFALYHADQYMAPSQGTYDTVQSVDGATWYKQYAQPAVNKTPYETDDGKVAYHESVVQKLPPVPQRKERI